MEPLDVINLDFVYDLSDTDERGHPLDPGFRRDRLSGRLYYSSRWLRERATSVGALPGPDANLLLEADRAVSHEPRDAEGAAMIARQLATRPDDGWIGPGRTMLGLVPTEEDRVRLAMSLLIGSLRAAKRCADRLAEVAGFESPVRSTANAAGNYLDVLAEGFERANDAR